MGNEHGKEHDPVGQDPVMRAPVRKSSPGRRKRVNIRLTNNPSPLLLPASLTPSKT
jgi:hypothetical protein